MTTRRQFHLRALGLGAAASACLALTRAQGGDYPNRPDPDRRAVRRPAAVPTSSRARWRSSWPRCSARAPSSSWTTSSAPAGFSRRRTSRACRARRLQPPARRVVARRAEGDGARRAVRSGEGLRAHHAHAVHARRSSWSAPTSPYKTVEDLVAAAKTKPGKLNYASGGVGSAAHLSARGDGAAVRASTSCTFRTRDRSKSCRRSSRATRSSRFRSARRRFRRSGRARCARWP